MEDGNDTKRESVWPYTTRASLAEPNLPSAKAELSMSMARRQDCRATIQMW